MNRRNLLISRLNLPLSAIVAQYDFDGNSNDSVGGFNGIDTNMSYSTGLGSNKSAVFNGTNSHIELPANIITNFSPLTLSALVKGDTSTGQQRFIVFNNNTVSGNQMPFMAIELNRSGSNNVSFVFISSSGTIVQTFSMTVTNWNHVALTASNNGNVAFYINGTQQFTTSIGTYSSVSVPANILGSNRRVNGLFYDGELSALKVWNQELTSDKTSMLATAELAGQKIN